VRGPYAAALGDAPHDNLVWRAAERLAAQVERPAAAALTLNKNLPVASGIGGGSSDAAAALKALAALWRLDLAATDLAVLGETLGADVPVCLGARAAWLGGIGESVEPTPAFSPKELRVTVPLDAHEASYFAASARISSFFSRSMERLFSPTEISKRAKCSTRMGRPMLPHDR